MAFTVQGVRVLTLEETAELFGVNRGTLYNWMDLGFPVMKVRNLNLVLEPKAKAWKRRMLVSGRLRYGAGVTG